MALLFLCGCGGMADTSDLKSAEEIREGSNPFIRTIRSLDHIYH